jgi:hypothetical protein
MSITVNYLYYLSIRIIDVYYCKLSVLSDYLYYLLITCIDRSYPISYPFVGHKQVLGIYSIWPGTVTTVNSKEAD